MFILEVVCDRSGELTLPPGKVDSWYACRVSFSRLVVDRPSPQQPEVNATSDQLLLCHEINKTELCPTKYHALTLSDDFHISTTASRLH